jgi:hypothetical protein
MEVYLCVSIDCECDKGAGWRTRMPLAFAGVVQGMRDRLQPLFRKMHGKPTYLLSPEVMRDASALEAISHLEGDAELGTHLHAEFAEPDAFVPDVTDAFQGNYPRDIERQKLDYLTRLFRKSFGHQPRSFRAGRFGIGRHSLGLLQELGYAVDSSVTPHMDWRRAGAPDVSFRLAGTQPYWPVLDDPERVAAQPGALLEVPVTIRPSLLSRVPVVGRWAEPKWLRPGRSNASQLIALARDEIRQAHASTPRTPVVLNCMFHNVEIVAGTSPYAATEQEADAILADLAGFLEWAERHGIKSVGLGDIPGLFAGAESAINDRP